MADEHEITFADIESGWRRRITSGEGRASTNLWGMGLALAEIDRLRAEVSDLVIEKSEILNGVERLRDDVTASLSRLSRIHRAAAP